MKGVNEKLIDLLIESEIIKNKYFSQILWLFSILILIYSFILILWTFIDIKFINYVNVWIISNILLVFISMISILWIIYFAKKWKEWIINKDILKEKIFKTMAILKWNKDKIINFKLVNSKNFTNYKNFIKRTYNNIEILIWINLNHNNLYFTFRKNEDLKNEFHQYLKDINIENELFENNNYWLYLIEDEELDINITEEELSNKIFKYVEHVNNFIEKKEKIF